jgi:hypothetical protein
MGAREHALGPICWILGEGLRQVDGRLATALFGNAVSLLSDGSQPLPLVPGIRTGGGTAFARDAIELVCQQLEMTNARRPRFVYVLSDGGWSDHARRRREGALACRAGRPDDPPLDRKRAARGRVRAHPRHQRPRPSARPDRRRQRRRAARSGAGEEALMASWIVRETADYRIEAPDPTEAVALLLDARDDSDFYAGVVRRELLPAPDGHHQPHETMREERPR